jgi:fatty-acyl-CoA synthase
MESVWLEAPRRGALARARITSLADIQAIEQTPFTDLLPCWSILGMVEHAARASPAKPAIVIVDKQDPTLERRRISYAELGAAIRATANRLRAVSCGSRPVVSILTPLLAESFIATWAGAAAGIANPINPYLRIDHVASIMNAAGTTVLVCGTAADGPGAWCEVNKLGEMVPTLRAIWFADQGSGSESFWPQIERAEHAQLTFTPEVDPDRTAALLHTGGTTAAPKLVRLSERGMLLNAWCCGAFNAQDPNDVAAVGMPYFHVGGATAAALATIVFGNPMVIVGPEGYRSARVISRFWDLIAAHGVTMGIFAPTTAAALLASYDGGKVPTAVRFWSGGATVPIQVTREFAEKFKLPLREGWGMTELQGALILTPYGADLRIGSIGIPFPYHRARCVALGSTNVDDPAAGDVGVLAISGPCVTAGYLDAERSADLYFQSSAPGEKWLNTGDLCTIDVDGYVWLRGRSKDLIIRGAHNIDPLLIEEALLQHPAVMYAAAVGEPDRDKGEMPVAYVQLRPGMSAPEAELGAHCRAEIAERAAVPRTVRILDAMPLTAVGKIFKPALRLDAIQQCVARVMKGHTLSASPEVKVSTTGGAISVVLIASDASMTESLQALRRELEHYTFRVQIEGGPMGESK